MIRTRRGIATAVALLLLMIITMAACGEQRSTTDDSATSSPSPAGKPPELVIDITKLEEGATPKIAWQEGQTLHDGDQAIRVPGTEPGQVAVLGNRIVARGDAEAGETEVQVRDRKGAITARYSGPLSRLVTNDERNIVAWIDEDNTPMVLQVGHKKPGELRREPKGKNGDAIAVIGNDCFHGPETVEGAGCSVYFTLARKNESFPFVASEHGIVDRVDTKITELQDVSEDGALIGLVNPSESRVCSRYESDAKSYGTCEHVLSEFAPGGESILGYPAEITEGPTLLDVSVHEAMTGKTRLTAQTVGGTEIWGMEWEDDSHFLAVVTRSESSTWAIVRIGLDGEMELAAGPKKDTESTTVYDFAVQP